ncbi:MAG TPA: PilZ domain-containing protein [Novosphingobium sp.]|nr:PilZ domain-containing protein [Novosphingobium sp.]
MTPERRRDTRSRAVIEAACRMDGVSHRARLINVSRQGCCAVMPRAEVVCGQRVLILLGSMIALPATVRWVEDGLAGLEFAAPLHGAMLARYGLGGAAGADTLH